MLSICIPVYNYNVLRLVSALLTQAQALPVQFEILVWEDGSEEGQKVENRKLVELDPKVQYVEWEKNRGRSIIRNRLAEAAKFPYLLFMDCDADLPDDHFLHRYAELLKEPIQKQVICGGRIYPKRPREASLQLHWLYGSLKESQPVERRRLAPNSSFMTNNFLITRSIFEGIQFNEDMQGYGHEDTLFGWELQKKELQIEHIDNPVIHAGLETSSEFLTKTEQGVGNLHRLYKLIGEHNSWINEIKLLRVFNRLKSWRATGITYWMLHFFQKPIERQLHSSKPSLLAFDLYKLYRFLDQDRR
ncbi:MAG: glycosyltransferase family 2 protein [Cyanothece sp. SIO1E1]|nr:glycosyltransferase family 2 protein [Cyanothece sp. SIO1E1]